MTDNWHVRGAPSRHDNAHFGTFCMAQFAWKLLCRRLMTKWCTPTGSFTGAVLSGWFVSCTASDASPPSRRLTPWARAGRTGEPGHEGMPILAAKQMRILARDGILNSMHALHPQFCGDSGDRNADDHYIRHALQNRLRRCATRVRVNIGVYVYIHFFGCIC